TVPIGDEFGCRDTWAREVATRRIGSHTWKSMYAPLAKTAIGANSSEFRRVYVAVFKARGHMGFIPAARVYIGLLAQDEAFALGNPDLGIGLSLRVFLVRAIERRAFATH